jgi:hypothetical protein
MAYTPNKSISSTFPRQLISEAVFNFLQEIRNYEASLENTEWDSTKTYFAKDLAKYNNELYECTYSNTNIMPNTNHAWRKIPFVFTNAKVVPYYSQTSLKDTESNTLISFECVYNTENKDSLRPGYEIDEWFVNFAFYIAFAVKNNNLMMQNAGLNRLSTELKNHLFANRADYVYQIPSSNYKVIIRNGFASKIIETVTAPRPQKEIFEYTLQARMYFKLDSFLLEI